MQGIALSSLIPPALAHCFEWDGDNLCYRPTFDWAVAIMSAITANPVRAARSTREAVDICRDTGRAFDCAVMAQREAELHRVARRAARRRPIDHPANAVAVREFYRADEHICTALELLRGSYPD